MLSKEELDSIKEAINHGDESYKIIGNKAYLYNCIYDNWEEVVGVESGSPMSPEEAMKRGGFKLKSFSQNE